MVGLPATAIITSSAAPRTTFPDQFAGLFHDVPSPAPVQLTAGETTHVSRALALRTLPTASMMPELPAVKVRVYDPGCAVSPASPGMVNRRLSIVVGAFAA